jgi:RNA polymerase sigma factor (sigma-70 family)
MGKDYRKALLAKSLGKLGILTHRERTILQMRYGVEENARPLKEIAAHFEVSEQTIRNHEEKAIRKLEKLLHISSAESREEAD